MEIETIMDKEYFKLAESYFDVWSDGEDFQWFAETWYKLGWGGSTKLNRERTKIFILTLANIYYEFCHEAYGLCYELLLEDDQEFLIRDCDISATRIRELIELEHSKKKWIDKPEDIEDYSLIMGLRTLIKLYKHEVFEDLFCRIGNVENSFKSIKPDWKIEYAGYEYIESWGGTYSNFW
ncbi:MAG: hypothetical protein A2315_10855 [Ignavibacteria bacterium RIFOXYB2_FULL_35_12]|nr:MAG: hypothetical protein A2058_03425 [Ignavibacteria bacterium GWA2_36_19]OGU61491.1 MAG: hypothetical protein A2X60_02110 [Ignavibacteria bacterium GWF2_35_20]OGU78553.1 MAG: hypothetical protein A2254_06000 [Ignavibacteria bacterium RIFOXYA2_FULL_35_9]OGU85523.1 MAG: hypothetical protein A3K31_05180 [Ignavibacteria bacterium RIFOXYA12_FULL_35_25]OGU90292.1 MAG: hypothetical protein A2492_10030 [Ignavibacteria bacterium RIFOXYC12_FULL_35_11]OGU96728.1 MAG: hypothetical protein A2347_05070